MSTKFFVVIGKNFGDEGKGRVTHILSDRPGKSLVVRHNGGAQSGHTVVIPSGEQSDDKLPNGDLSEKRFIFHEIGSGSFCGADTLWIDTFFPDLFKLREEYESFALLSGIRPRIYALPGTNITTVCDVLFNMALEASRGKDRHGSCGMGIYEAFLRVENGYGLTVSEVKNLSIEALFERLVHIRDGYYRPRAMEFFGEKSSSQYLTDLFDDVVLRNTAIEMKKNAFLVEIVTGDTAFFLKKYDNVIFETGQGLLLDSENKEYAPNVTGSRTGLTNPHAFLRRYGLKIDEVVYVTRSYVTRHGAGKLPFECDRTELGNIAADTTNVTNPWQGTIRYAPHVSIKDFIDPVIQDLKQLDHLPKINCAITHLTETDGKIVFADRAMDMTADSVHYSLSKYKLFDKIWKLS